VSLTITLSRGAPLLAGEPLALRAIYRNTSAAPIALTFWWTRRMRVVDEAGRPVDQAPGPVAPCGAAEEWTVLPPGGTCERDEPLACTQPAGVQQTVGWSYPLPAGRYRVSLLFQQPPLHGFTQSTPHAAAFTGSIESTPLDVMVGERPSWLTRLFGR
jgi:hypothetical protein